MGAGSRYATIYIVSDPVAGGQVGIRFAVNVPVVLTVLNTQMGKSGLITDISAVQLSDGSTEIQTSFINSGNTHYRAYNQITVRDASGNEVADAVSEVTTASFIPTFERLLKHSPPK